MTLITVNKGDNFHNIVFTQIRGLLSLWGHNITHFEFGVESFCQTFDDIFGGLENEEGEVRTPTCAAVVWSGSVGNEQKTM